MTIIALRRALREAHQKTARLLAEREALQFTYTMPDGAYFKQIADRLRREVVESHRSHVVPPELDAPMFLHASEAFSERFEELMLEAHPPAANDDEGGTVH